MVFYDIFEQQCRKKGVTPTQAARDNDIRQSVVSMWKKRGSTPKAETVQKLADYFDVQVDYLLGNDFWSSLSDDQIEEMAKSAPTPEEIKRAGFSLRINLALEELNFAGLKKAQERVEELTEIPRYRAETAPQSTPVPRESQSTTPPPGAPETASEGTIQAITMFCPQCGQRITGNPATRRAYCPSCKKTFPLA